MAKGRPPDFILLQPPKPIPLSGKNGMPLARSRDHAKIKDVSVGHLGRLRVPPDLFCQLRLQNTFEHDTFVGGGLIALNHHRVALRPAAQTDGLIHLREHILPKNIL